MIRNIEEEAVDKQGSALVCEFRFQEDGRVTVVYSPMEIQIDLKSA